MQCCRIAGCSYMFVITINCFLNEKKLDKARSELQVKCNLYSNLNIPVANCETKQPVAHFSRHALPRIFFDITFADQSHLLKSPKKFLISI